MRDIKGALLRLSAAIREGRLISGLKRRINSLHIFRQLVLTKEQNQSNLSPRAAHIIETRNKKNPAIKLSPRAARIYVDLQKAIEERKI
jgi:hypothetical protein